MGNIKHIFTALVLMLIAISCSEGIEINTSENEFVGDWNWISTDGGLAFNIHETPQTADKSIQLKLTADSKYSVLENNVVVASGTYEIMLENSIYSQNMEPFIQLSEKPLISKVVLNGIIRIENDSLLTISDNFYDGIGSTFRRLE